MSDPDVLESEVELEFEFEVVFVPLPSILKANQTSLIPSTDFVLELESPVYWYAGLLFTKT